MLVKGKPCSQVVLDDLDQITAAVRLRTPDLSEPVPQCWGKLDIQNGTFKGYYTKWEKKKSPKCI